MPPSSETKHDADPHRAQNNAGGVVRVAGRYVRGMVCDLAPLACRLRHGSNRGRIWNHSIRWCLCRRRGRLGGSAAPEIWGLGWAVGSR